MYYVTHRTNPETLPELAQLPQITFEQLLRGKLPDLPIPLPTAKIQTRTIEVTELNQEALNALAPKLVDFLQTVVPILAHYPENTQMREHYSTFYIPKHSGGMRKIDAPDDQLKTDLRNIKEAFEKLGILAHTCAYAYVPGRCAKDAIERHQKTGHKWYLKMDLHDFFGTCSKNFILHQLLQIGTFSIIGGNTLLHDILNIAMLNGGLPQGTPLSPWLTNQIMLPIDHELNKFCQQHNVTYTRYADDMLFSADSKNYLETVMIAKVHEILHGTPLQINEEKTKISSICGQNWNLGLMVNKDNNITVGYKKKERFRATLTNFCITQETWSHQETMEFLGLLQYYLSIEPEYFQNVLTKYNEKFNMDIRSTILRKLRSI